jgi:hypothetical protein
MPDTASWQLMSAEGAVHIIHGQAGFLVFIVLCTMAVQGVTFTVIVMMASIECGALLMWTPHGIQ